MGKDHVLGLAATIGPRAPHFEWHGTPPANTLNIAFAAANAGDNCYIPDFNIGALGNYPDVTSSLDATLALDLLMLPLAFIAYYAAGNGDNMVSKSFGAGADVCILAYS